MKSPNLKSMINIPVIGNGDVTTPDECHKMFADTGATVVYATSEPLEALMLGGYTATLNEGRVIQFGYPVVAYDR